MKRWILTLAVLLVPALVMAGSGKVYVYNWTEYMPDEVLAKFEKETGIKVNYTTYESNEAMYAKLKLVGGAGYDVVFPSTYFVSKMVREKMLLPLSKAELPNWRHLEPTLLNKPFDPQNRHSVPYMWGSSGLVANTAFVKKGAVTSWKDLWKPEFKSRVLLTDDLREVFGMALLVKGYSINDTNPAHIKEAYLELKKLMPNVRLFSADNPKAVYLSHEVYTGMLWNGEHYMAAEEDPSIAFTYPKEGAIFWVDNMVIPKGAKNVKNAHAFINFILRPDIAAEICEYVGYATPVKDALPLLPVKLRNNRVVFPPAAEVKRGEFQSDVGETLSLYEKYWEMLKTGH